MNEMTIFFAYNLDQCKVATNEDIVAPDRVGSHDQYN